MRTLFAFLVILTISLTTSAQICELDRGDFHLKVFKLDNRREILLVESPSTGDSQALGISRDSITIEDVQLNYGVLEVFYTDRNGDQKAIFEKVGGDWKRVLSRLEEQRIWNGRGYSPTGEYDTDAQEERPLMIKRRTVIQRGYSTENP